MFFLGILCGCVATIVLMVLYAQWYTPRAQADIDATLDDNIRESMERVVKDSKWGEKARAQLQKHKSQIEFEAIERLKHAMDRAERTGQPVKVELAGIEEYIYVSPPPGLKKEDPN